MKTISLIINKIMMKLAKRWRCKLCIIFGGHVLNDVNGGYVQLCVYVLVYVLNDSCGTSKIKSREMF